MLPFAPVTYFHEEQRLRDSWLWLIVIVPFVVLLAVVLVPRAPASAVAVAFAVGLLVALLLAFARLETTVTPEAVIVSFHGVWPTRRIKLDDIAAFEPMRYTMWDSGGWGVHLGFAGMTYNVSGNEGIHFQLKDGGRVLVGTQRSGEFTAAVSKAIGTRPAT
jgi:hypothetical protein